MKRRKRQIPWPAVLDERPSDFDFEPSWSEKLWDRLVEMKKQWAAEDEARLRRRYAQITIEIEAEKEKQAREALLNRDRDYWLRQREADRPAMEKLTERYQSEVDLSPFRQKLLKVVAKLDKEIRRDAAKAEREALAARGLIRGRRK
jgi:hypothetical protein